MTIFPGVQDCFDAETDLKQLGQWRQSLEKALDDALSTGTSIRDVVQARSDAIDSLLRFLWARLELPAQGIALIAVGGYGRGEMLPYSDVDLMVLSQESLSDDVQQQVSQFLASLWDVGLAPGSSVRTLEECLQAARDDISVATTLVESRLLEGDAELGQLPRRIVSQSWSERGFFDQKMAEQSARHAQHNDTVYNLEPDLKNAPGGLRDINQIGWISKRHFRVARYYDLVHLGFISDFEFRELQKAEDFLWLLRHHLHRLTRRNENRLLFDYQRELAGRLGYQASDDEPNPNAAVERFMRDYYRVAMQVSTLNEMLLAYFYESVIEPRLPEAEQPDRHDINPRFELIGGKLAVKHHRVFAEHPSALLEIFFLMANHAESTGIRARTLRLLMLAAKTIDAPYRSNPVHQALFMAILRSPHQLYETLLAMKRYGVLGRYLPAFGQIIGLMQYDLFHIYTVDYHTLLLIRNLRRFADAEYKGQFPVVSPVFERLDRKEIVYLAALFHDIAKGRGGDHSELGAVDALEFCARHGLSKREAGIVAWLTENHLLMSLTAQKKDISDPEVVQDFAREVGDLVHLDYLFVLTVADINATNPKLWNSWRATLLRTLYTETRRMLRLGLDTPIDRAALIEETQEQALQQLLEQFHEDDVRRIWTELGEDYFLRERPSEIVWHTSAILQHGSLTEPLVMLREHRAMMEDAAQLFIYTRDRPNLFAATVILLDQFELDVQDARIITGQQGFSLDTYMVLDRSGQLMQDPSRQAALLDSIRSMLAAEQPMPEQVRWRMPRQLKHFNIASEVNVRALPMPYQAAMQAVEIITLDRPGLLAQIGQLFASAGVDIHSARIATLGERAEDVFFISDAQGQPLSEEALHALQLTLKAALDQGQNQSIPASITF